MIAWLRRLLADEQGAVLAEVAVYVPAAALLAAMVWAYGATDTARSSVLHAAISAARVASLAPTAAKAQQEATATAHQVLDEHKLPCHTLTVTVDTAGFRVPVGQFAMVNAEVTCQISLADLYVSGLQGDQTIRERWVSALDTFRTRT